MGPALADPGAVAARLYSRTAAERPTFIRFQWDYADHNGRLRGDGVARINPPDKFRLDFFTTGEGSMSAVLARDSLTTLGEIEDVQLPAPAFLYAMAGLFRPGAPEPSRSFRSGDADVLVYETGGGATRFFFVAKERVVRLEERAEGRVSRRIELEWKGETGWPAEAEYRDNLTPSRARWRLIERRTVPEPYAEAIFELEAPG